MSEASETRISYLRHGYSIQSWLLTTDHKRIAILFLITLTAMFAIGALGAALVRLELVTPEQDVINRDIYNRMFTMHGTVMVWFFLIPSIPTVLGNFLLPMMLGARDLAMPRLNLASWYVFTFGAVFGIVALLVGGVDTGWTFYTPFSTAFANPAMIWMAIGIFVAGFSSIMTGLNFIVTTHTLRAPGMGWLQLPLFVWSLYATSIILVLATPVLAITLLLITVEKVWGVGVFDPALGGDPLLFQHFFWFYSHPAVYIMILPGMGFVSEAITTFSRNPPFGYLAIALSSVAIAVLGFLVWGHHMFVSGQSLYAGLIFSILSYLVAIPSAIKILNWTATLHRGRIYMTTPMLYALGFVGLFTIGGLTGLMVAAAAVDVHVHDTYFVVAHFHYIMVGGMMHAYLGGLHYWWPKMSGRMYPENWGRVSAIILFVGFNLTFFPQFILGYLGMPRRYATYPEEWQMLNILSTAGSSILGVGYLLPIFYLLWSLKHGPVAGPNPWRATGLEWQTPSPPPKHNFVQTPIVTDPPYHYEDRDREHASIPNYR